MAKARRFILWVATLALLGGLSALSLQVAGAQTAAAVPLATLPPTQVAPAAPPLSLTLTLLFTCCAVGLVVGVIVLMFILSFDKRKQPANSDK